MTGRQLSFAGEHTVSKLDMVERYLSKYLQALQKAPFEKVFFDAFAGTGRIPIVGADHPSIPGLPETSAIDGSARRALSLPVPFDKYILTEKSSQKLAELKECVANEFGHLVGRTLFAAKDVNDAVKEFCADTDWRSTRAVLFLDPFGNQVRWDTIEAVAATRGIDLWYLFPSGNGVFRQIRKKGGALQEAVQTINLMLGTDTWQQEFVVEETKTDLFGIDTIESFRSTNPGQVTQFALERLKGLFGAGVLETYVPLGRNGMHQYSLIFACGNEKGAPIAKRIAEGVIRAAQRDRSGRPK